MREKRNVGGEGVKIALAPQGGVEPDPPLSKKEKRSERTGREALHFCIVRPKKEASGGAEENRPIVP